MPTRTPAEWAADTSLPEVWDRRLPFPGPDTMPDLDVVTHVTVERAQPDGYHYLHESGIAVHDGVLHLGWANHRQAEFNVVGECLRGTRSTDGLKWAPVTPWATPPENGSNSYNHPVLATHQGQLRGFFTRWDGTITEEELLAGNLGCCNAPGVGPQPAAELFTFTAGAWRTTGATIPGFLPFRPPLKMADGNWIMSGEIYWFQAAVAISDGDDWSRWRVVPIAKPDAMSLLFPETALIVQGDRLLAFCRPQHADTAPVAESRDRGNTWTPLTPSNYPLAESQPFAGFLSTGQQYLLTNDLVAGRHLLSIAVTAPGGGLFERVWKVRHQPYPRRRLFPGYVIEGKVRGDTRGKETEWSYPAAVEHDGKLFISYTQGKEDCVLSIVPVDVLSVH